MKKLIKYFALAGLGIVALSSCDNEKFLDVPKYDILDISTQFEGDDNARLGLNGIYAYNNVSKEDNSWGYKPNLFTGSHPTMDTQCTGWDVKFLDQTWDANVGELGEGWSHAYAAICRANLYLTGLETAEDVSPEAKKLCEGEARALRGYFYTWLATTFGRVPMLATGEDFNNTPEKAAAETYEEMWDFIIEDFQAAANLLDWTPYNGQYGRCTKGMAKAYKEAISVFQAELKTRKIAMTLNERGIVITLSTDAYFRKASAELDIDMARSVLEKVAALINQPAFADKAIRIEGHTDNTPTDPDGPWVTNWNLSTSRALNVLDYLVDFGADPRKLSVVGYGEYQPISNNDTEEERSKNRRVDIIILREK